MNIEKMWNKSNLTGRRAILRCFWLHYKYDASDALFEELGFQMQLDMLHSVSYLVGK